MENGQLKILIYGYGNPGRRDDGLGPACVHLISQWLGEQAIKNVNTDSNYQLNIEDAYSIRDYDMVIFIDASIEELPGYELIRVTPSEEVSYTMHAMHPSFVLDLCRKLYGRSPEVLLMKIKGYDFQLEEGLSDKASANLRKAFSTIKKVIQDPEKYLTIAASAINV
jgi:hydrogenase maturation protease